MGGLHCILCYRVTSWKQSPPYYWHQHNILCRDTLGWLIMQHTRSYCVPKLQCNRAKLFRKLKKSHNDRVHRLLSRMGGWCKCGCGREKEKCLAYLLRSLILEKIQKSLDRWMDGWLKNMADWCRGGKERALLGWWGLYRLLWFLSKFYWDWSDEWGNMLPVILPKREKHINNTSPQHPSHIFRNIIILYHLCCFLFFPLSILMDPTFAFSLQNVV